MNPDTGQPASSEEARAEQLGTLLRRARSGERRALDAIIDRLMPLLWNVARAQGLDTETASDVVQTAWLALLEQLEDIRTPDALAGWLITVTRREAWRVRDQLRRDRRVEPDELTTWPDPAGDIEANVADDELYRVLWQNLRLLSPRCQELLRIAAFVDRPDYAMIAEILGMPRGSIGPTRGRCLAKLRTLLAEDPHWSLP